MTPDERDAVMDSVRRHWWYTSSYSMSPEEAAVYNAEARVRNLDDICHHWYVALQRARSDEVAADLNITFYRRLARVALAVAASAGWVFVWLTVP